ncbi:MAG: hypothetical protein K9L17_11765 [Clostridiales bacterium]|nr:hypothetical protein [Clostridiales bacterium]MCF8023359.1 hypothetical protein [Clostridiales bacterium]
MEEAELNCSQKLLENKINTISSQVDNLQSRLAEKSVVEERLSNRVNMLRNNYEVLTRKYQETKMSSSAKIGEANIMVLSEAVQPEAPVAPKKKLNVAVAGVLGLMISVFIVFFREFWRNSALDNEESS